MSRDDFTPLRGLNNTRLFGHVDKVEYHGEERVILDRDKYSSYEPNGFYSGDAAYYCSYTVDNPGRYSRTGYIGFKELGDKTAVIHTDPRGEEIAEFLEGERIFINILPRFMDPRSIP